MAELREILEPGIEIRVRHELERYQRELLARLGATYVVDPQAPPCANLRCEKCELLYVEGVSRKEGTVNAVAPESQHEMGWRDG